MKDDDNDRNDRGDRQAGSGDVVGAAAGAEVAGVAREPGEEAHPVAQEGLAGPAPVDAGTPPVVDARPAALVRYLVARGWIAIPINRADPTWIRYRRDDRVMLLPNPAEGTDDLGAEISQCIEEVAEIEGRPATDILDALLPPAPSPPLPVGFTGTRSRVIASAQDGAHVVTLAHYVFPDGSSVPYVELSESHDSPRPGRVMALSTLVHLAQNASEDEVWGIGNRAAPPVSTTPLDEARAAWLALPVEERLDALTATDDHAAELREDADRGDVRHVDARTGMAALLEALAALGRTVG